MDKKICNSCKAVVSGIPGSVSFLCPKCGRQEIVRCEKCRRAGTRYACAECGFEGPN